MSWSGAHFKETNQDVKNSDYLKMQSVGQSEVICSQKWAVNAHEKWPGLGRVHGPLSKQVSSSLALWVFRGAEARTCHWSGQLCPSVRLGVSCGGWGRMLLVQCLCVRTTLPEDLLAGLTSVLRGCS